MGKGGVGKTTLAHTYSKQLASLGKKVLLCEVLQVTEKEQKLLQVNPNLWHITLNATDCFHEYIILKLKIKTLYSMFLSNKLTKYLQKAAPGVREMVLLGKIWFERLHYDSVIVDMPSTGYALTMLHTPFNYSALFPGGPVSSDATEMISTFSDPKQTALVVIALAETMPIQESLELIENLKTLIPTNSPHLIVNRCLNLPQGVQDIFATKPQDSSPLHAVAQYLAQKQAKQKQALSGLNIPFYSIPEG